MCVGWASGPSSGRPLGPKHMHLNPDMMHTSLDVASEQGFELALHQLNVAFRRATSDTADVGLARRLLDAGVNLQDAMAMPCATPLVLAVANGHEDMVRFLLDNNARVDQRAPSAQPTALEVANGWIDRSPSVVKLLLQRQADPGSLKA